MKHSDIFASLCQPGGLPICPVLGVCLKPTGHESHSTQDYDGLSYYFLRYFCFFWHQIYSCRQMQPYPRLPNLHLWQQEKIPVRASTTAVGSQHDTEVRPALSTEYAYSIGHTLTIRCHDVKWDIGLIAVVKRTIISTSCTLSVVDVGKPTVAWS